MMEFSELAKIYLMRAGWFPKRSMDISLWIDFLQEQKYHVFDAAADILRHLGGLKVDSHIWYQLRDEVPIVLANQTLVGLRTCRPFDFLAVEAPDADYDSAVYWKTNSFIRTYGLDVCPIGAIGENLTLFVVSDGRIFEGEYYAPAGYEKQASLNFLGNNIMEAVNQLIGQCFIYL